MHLYWVIFDTKFYNNRWRPLNFRRIWFFFFIVTSNFKNSMYPRSFLCEEAKIKQRTPLKKELCEIGEEARWESRFTSGCECIYIHWVILNSIRYRFSWELRDMAIQSRALLQYIETKMTLEFYTVPEITHS